MKLLLLCGSLRSGSTNEAVLRTAAEMAPERVAAVIYEGAGRLPLFNPDDDAEGAPMNEAVAELRRLVAAADAILICTPEYAGALPAAMKNVLEWTVGDAGTYGKPVAWINAAGPASPTGAADAHESLRKVLRYVGATIIEEACARVPVSRDVVSEEGTITDEDARREIRRALEALVSAET
jgi:chromate reductase, NAD(P)H dehydrogenase (quinone)